MGVRILEGKKDNSDDDIGAALYCSTTNVMLECHLFDDADQAQRFLDWLKGDPRDFDAAALGRKWSEFYDYDAAHGGKSILEVEAEAGDEDE